MLDVKPVGSFSIMFFVSGTSLAGGFADEVMGRWQ